MTGEVNDNTVVAGEVTEVVLELVVDRLVLVTFAGELLAPGDGLLVVIATDTEVCSSCIFVSDDLRELK